MSKTQADNAIVVVNIMFAAFHDDDFDQVRKYATQDLQWTVYGEGPLAGTYYGVDAFIDLISHAKHLSENRETIEIIDFLSNDTTAMLHTKVHALTSFDELNIEHFYVINVRHGRVYRGRTIPCDQKAFSEFWSKAAAK